MTETNDLDPVFLSYRHSDGDVLAEQVAWVLRSHGVPVWHDQTHLPPGQFDRRLDEALESGLSGAVLLLTPDIEFSDIVRTLELPKLLKKENDSAFTFAIGSVVTRADGKLDYEAPDRLVAQRGRSLRDFDQFDVSLHSGRAKLAGEMAVRRVRRAASGERLHLDIQTRLPAFGTPHVPLAVRTRPPLAGTSVPPPQAWEEFAAFLGNLPRLVQAAGVQHLHVTGGAHLSMAFALGAAVPTTTGLTVVITDQHGADWSTGTAAAVPLAEQEVTANGAVRDPVAVYLDLVPSAPNKEFRTYIKKRRFARAVEIAVVEREPLRAEAGPALVAELRRRLGVIADGRPVHLFMRVPFPIAVLLGRSSNTIRTTLYEWERENENPTYLEVATVSAGRGGGPVVSYNASR